MAFNAAELTAMAIPYGIKLISAIVTLVVGLMIANMLVSLTRKVMTKGQVDPSLISFLGSMAGITLKVLVYVTALSVLGIEMTSFVAILGAAGLAVGLALFGTLQNFAGGVTILFFKPYKIGNVIAL